jgi:uncharacterized protein
MTKVKLRIYGISNSQTQTGAYALILGEANGLRRLPIIIGGFEAQSIAIELEGMKPNRPLTHDLIKSLASVFHIQLLEVVVNKFHEGVFFAQLICSNEEGETIEIDSRTSDAVALALRFGCPIYAEEEVLRAAGIELPTGTIQHEMQEESDDDDDDDIPDFSDDPFAELSDDELEELLNDMILHENYERASLIRDELNRRKL